jgi:hypothetical protein
MKGNEVLARRLREVRLEKYGEQGGPLMAEAMGLPARTWAHYESGVTIHGPALLRFIDVSGVEPRWLLTGQGEKYRLGPRIVSDTGLQRETGWGLSRHDSLADPFSLTSLETRARLVTSTSIVTRRTDPK